jgi:MFS transporter, ACS family, tartrate transporter
MATTADLPTDTMRLVSRRILMFLFVAFVFNQLDRVNVSFAALQMNAQLGFTAEVYGLGVGLFFVSYLLFEIPSNMLLQRFGARVWLARIMVTWGMVAVAMAFISGQRSFYALRFLLGLAEAGFVPGYLYYLRLWVPERWRGWELTKIALAIPLAVILGGPVSGLLLKLGSIGGLAGWQWMFVLEGVPTILLGVLAFWRLTETPQEADWLSQAQRTWLIGEIDREQAAIGKIGPTKFSDTLRDRRVIACAAAFFCASMSTYGIIYWLPQILRQLSGLGNSEVSLLATLPFVGLGVGMYLNTRHSDRSRERHLHFAVAALFAAAGLVVAAVSSDPWIGLAGLVACGTGLGGALGVFWTIPMGLLSGTAAAGGFALVNMVGNSAGFVSPYLIGIVRTTTGSFAAGLYVLAVFMAGSALLIRWTRHGGYAVRVAPVLDKEA